MQVWPVGFRSRRLYTSKHQKDKRVWYESEIFDAGVEGKAPMTRVTALGEDPPYSYVGPTPTHAWQQAIEAVNNVSHTRRRCAVRRPPA